MNTKRPASTRASCLAGLSDSGVSGAKTRLRPRRTPAASRQAGTSPSIQPSAWSSAVSVTHEEKSAARGGEPPGRMAHGTASRRHQAASVPPVVMAALGTPFSPASR